MILFRYEKVGAAAYLSHLDVLRLFGRTVRRAGIEVRFSEGFHPHQRFGFCNPVGLGTESVAEYGSADCDLAGPEFAERFNRVSVEGVRILQAKQAERDPNFAKLLVVSDYEIFLKDAGRFRDPMIALVRDPEFSVIYEHRNLTKTVADKVLRFDAEEDFVRVRLKSGAENLKADLLAQALQRAVGLKGRIRVRRTEQYAETGQGLKNASEWLL